MAVGDKKDVESRDREDVEMRDRGELAAVDDTQEVEQRLLRPELRASFERVFAHNESGLRYLADH